MSETLQFKILTGMMAASDEKGYFKANPFFHATEATCKENIEEAKRVYEKEVFPNFVSAWCMKKASERGISLGGVVDAIHGHLIPPIPNYTELRKFAL